MEVIKGIPVAPGVVIGRTFVLDDVVDHVPYHTVAAADRDTERQRLESAIDDVLKDLIHDRDRAAEKLGPEPAKIFEFHLGLLQDSTLIDPVRNRVSDDGVSAAYAVSEGFQSLASQFRNMDSEVFRQKASDVMDLDRRLLGKLVGQSEDRLAKLDEPVLLVAHELTPAQVASLEPSMVLALAMDTGGRTSHNSIVAAALGIPVVVGCKDISSRVNDNELIVIDGKAGIVVIRPDDQTLENYQRSAERMAGITASLQEIAELDSVTKDGVHIELLGNIEFPHEIESVLQNGGEGVGLYRTEFLYLTSPTEPTEEDLYQAYKQSIELLQGRPLIIRTLDLGADKYTQERAAEPERNPFLGLRSIRFCLQNLPIFTRQLKAILRASVHGPVKLMFPLISTALELRQAKMVLQDVMEECQEQGIDFDAEIPIGIMIEVPSAALMASVFAREVSFFSIGTNDLIQYTLAVDRGNERVANLYTGANPAVIQLVKAVIRTGKRFDVKTSLCGEIAGETLYTMLLIGLGLRTLSLVATQIPYVKRVIRSVDIAQCERLARKVGSFDSERKILNTLRQELKSVLPEMDGGWTTD